MRRWFVRGLPGVMVAAFLLGSPAVARAHVIEIMVSNNVFTPEFVVINRGDTVRWIFDEGVHSTTADDGSWDSGLLNPGDTFSVTFTGTGQYDYYCTIHLDCCHMMGTVYVLDLEPVSVPTPL